MNPPIYYIKDGSLSFAEKILFKNIEFFLYPNDRICLIGRNGCGKSSLLKVITKHYTLDKGEIYIDPGVSIGYLAQNQLLQSQKTVYEYILESTKHNNEAEGYKVDILLDNLKINGNDILSNLSGGQLRRVSLAKALIEEPSILLLDEPTNHLDIASIEWLEKYLITYPGAVICISHDRSFLTNVTNKLWWLDRGNLRKSDKGFKYFEEWQEQIINEDISALNKLGKKLEQENIWLQQGVTARRKRNQKRLASLISLREKLKSQQKYTKKNAQKINIHDIEDKIKSKFIIEADELNYSYSDREVVRNFSIRIIKGEKIGLIGPNGSGKTTIVKLLAGLIKPDSGKINHGTNLEISYFDQNRVELKNNDTLWQSLCPTGGDQVLLPNGHSLHVAAYLKNFLFDPKQLNSKISTLSGGEANRLMLAKILAKPGNFLILDEPTNDLDMDSLEMLNEILSEYQGTLLIVSHDRDFLEKLVTRTLVFTETGKVTDLIGGYEDYKKYYKTEKTLPNSKIKKNLQSNTNTSPTTNSKKLSYKYQRRLEIIPILIKELEAKCKSIEEKLTDSNLYSKDPAYFNQLSKELSETKTEIDDLEFEWLEIANIQQEKT